MQQHVRECGESVHERIAGFTVNIDKWVARTRERKRTWIYRSLFTRIIAVYALSRYLRSKGLRKLEAGGRRSAYGT